MCLWGGKGWLQLVNGYRHPKNTNNKCQDLSDLTFKSPLLIVFKFLENWGKRANFSIFNGPEVPKVRLRGTAPILGEFLMR